MKDVTDATFQVEVVERSKQVPVVIDLWAPWCGPCKTLGPTIEKVVNETEGRVELVKVNVDENPAISQAFRVQSIPAVFALKDGKVIDTFVGALPESAVREFVAKLAPVTSPADLLVAIGDEESLLAALELEPNNEGAIAALAEVWVEQSRFDEALSLLKRIPETEATARVASLARLRKANVETANDEELEKRLNILLDSVKADEAARAEFVDLLRAFPIGDERIAQYRRKLTSRLY
ncbi:MAG: thioredoxin [Acidimicrobiaceae bacterium]|nr:thioredoxin [Acidimicrobiaceae bacterium]